MSGALDFSAEARRRSVLDAFMEKGDFPAIMPEEQIEELVDRVIALDEAYIEASGVNEGAVYDDDAAFDCLYAKMIEAYPAYKAYIMRFVEDYMAYNEAYLESVGAIEWE